MRSGEESTGHRVGEISNDVGETLPAPDEVGKPEWADESARARRTTARSHRHRRRGFTKRDIKIFKSVTSPPRRGTFTGDSTARKLPMMDGRESRPAPIPPRHAVLC
jgi:hypothetical protein